MNRKHEDHLYLDGDELIAAWAHPDGALINITVEWNNQNKDLQQIILFLKTEQAEKLLDDLTDQIGRARFLQKDLVRR